MKKLSFLLLAAIMLLPACSPQSQETGSESESASESTINTDSNNESSNEIASEQAYDSNEPEVNEPCVTRDTYLIKDTNHNESFDIHLESPCGWKAESKNDSVLVVSSPDEEAQFIFPADDFGLHNATTQEGTILGNGTSYDVTWFEFEDSKGAIIKTEVGENKSNIQLTYQTEEQKTALENMLTSFLAIKK